MLDKKILKQGATCAALAVLYVAAIATLMTHLEAVFGPGPDTDGDIFAPMLFLLLLVVSVATMAVLVFGKPLMLYIDGKKREAVSMVLCTIGSLAVFIVALLAALTATHA